MPDVSIRVFCYAHVDLPAEFFAGVPIHSGEGTPQAATGYPDLGRLTVAVEPGLTAPTVTVTRPALSARRRRRPKAALEKGESLHRTGVRVGVPARRSVTTSRLPRSMAQRFERTGAARSRRRAALLLRARTSGRIRVAGTCRRVIAMRPKRKRRPARVEACLAFVLASMAVDPTMALRW